MGKNVTVTSAFIFATIGLIIFSFKEKITQLDGCSFVFFVFSPLVFLMIPFIVWIMNNKKNNTPEAKARLEISKIEINQIEVKKITDLNE